MYRTATAVLLTLAAAPFAYAEPACHMNTAKAEEVVQLSAAPDEPSHDHAAGETMSAMEAMEKCMTVAPEHEMLNKLTGEWETTSEFVIMPGTEAMKTTGTCTAEIVGDGRFVKRVYKGDMMGMPYEGTEVMGYDVGGSRFQNVYMDNMGTAMYFLQGNWSDDGKTLEMKGRIFDPMVGKEVEVRHVLTASEGKLVLEAYGPDAKGKEFKSMTIVSTKK